MSNVTMAAYAAGAMTTVAVGALVAPVSAQEYCVSCKAPSALYRCVLDSPAPTGIPLKTLCTETLSRQGGHAACDVRTGTVFDCDAPVRRINTKAAAEAIAKPHAPAAKPPASMPPAKTKGSPAPAPEKAREAQAPPASDAEPPGPPSEKRNGPALSFDNLSEGLSRTTRETGDAIKNSTRKTIDCFSSLFKSC